ncbi:unnamed protein product [Leptidea sinapis]|uniref:Uncharacterized protein n=1 Tax=Leptidea sinapis TaxID=189913 RepID=A0A5E4PR32_9NEOP|nr:unnamed protein product [Leptidea sinapis]
MLKRRAPPAPARATRPRYGGGGGGRWGWGGWAPPAYQPRHPRFTRPRDTVDRSRPIIAYNDLDFPDTGDIF